MNRIEIIEKLYNLEGRKKQFEAMKKDLEGRYFEVCFIKPDISTGNRKYYQDISVEVNKTLFLDYVEKEILSMEKQINTLIKHLKEG